MSVIDTLTQRIERLERELERLEAGAQRASEARRILDAMQVRRERYFTIEEPVGAGAPEDVPIWAAKGVVIGAALFFAWFVLFG